MRAESLGETGRAWVARLPDLVRELEQLWGVEAGGSLAGGSESLVAEATRADGTEAVLKVGLPGSADLNAEATVYRLASGRGYAKLLAHDPERNALLLERLGMPLSRRCESTGARIRAICRTFDDAWVSAGLDHGLMTGAEKARWLANFIAEQWHALGQPCSAKAKNQALDYAEERAAAFNPEQSVLVHGDAHAENTLIAEDPGADASLRGKFIDPDGLIAEKACDLAPIMRDWSEELLAGNTEALTRARCDLLAELTDVPTRPIWQWGYMERVSTGLVMLAIGQREEARQTLAVADGLAGVAAPE
ncbi:MAG: phosphotransferase [Gammaproteobacteria bacterium]|nr:phosphotransferase [Gammaproteobacteria bacterium]